MKELVGEFTYAPAKKIAGLLKRRGFALVAYRAALLWENLILRRTWIITIVPFQEAHPCCCAMGHVKFS